MNNKQKNIYLVQIMISREKKIWIICERIQEEGAVKIDGECFMTRWPDVDLGHHKDDGKIIGFLDCVCSQNQNIISVVVCHWPRCKDEQNRI